MKGVTTMISNIDTNNKYEVWRSTDEHHFDGLECVCYTERDANEIANIYQWSVYDYNKMILEDLGEEMYEKEYDGRDAVTDEYIVYHNDSMDRDGYVCSIFLEYMTDTEDGVEQYGGCHKVCDCFSIEEANYIAAHLTRRHFKPVEIIADGKKLVARRYYAIREVDDFELRQVEEVE